MRDYSPFGCLFWLLVFYYLFLGLFGKIGSLFWALYLPVGLIILLVGGFMIKIKFDKNRQIRIQRSTKCKHGMEGGESLNLCKQCKIEKAEKVKLELLKKEKEEFYQKLKIEANRLKNEELKKIREFNLKNKEYIRNLSHQEFENVIAELYRKLGYIVKQTPFSNDRGKDAILTKENKKYLIECKHYSIGKSIGRPHLQKFLAAIIEEKAEKGFFITTSNFTKTAIDYAVEFNIECIDLDNLVELFISAYGNENDLEIRHMCGICGDILNFKYSRKEEKKKCTNGHLVFLDSDSDFDFKSPKKQCNDKLCDKCGKKMKLIKGKYGLFWGCSDYPTCRNTNIYKKYF